MVLVVLDDDTRNAVLSGRIAVPGFDAEDKKGARLLFGAALGRLAMADAHVIAFACSFSETLASYDEAFVKGVELVRCPVVVGVSRYGRDGEPMLSGIMRKAGCQTGSLKAVFPGTRADEILAPLLVEKRDGRCMPSLALASLTAARREGGAVRYGPEGSSVRITYESGFSEQIPASEVDLVGARGRGVEEGVRAILANVPLKGRDECGYRTVSCRAVLEGDASWLRSLFNGHVVVVGSALSSDPRYETLGYGSFYGCELQAQIIDGVLRGAAATRLPKYGLVLRTLLYAAIAGLLAQFVRISAVNAPRVAVALIGGIVVALVGARVFTHPYFIEIGIAVATGLVGVSVPLLVRRLLSRWIPALAAAPAGLAEPVSRSGSTDLPVRRRSRLREFYDVATIIGAALPESAREWYQDAIEDAYGELLKGCIVFPGAGARYWLHFAFGLKIIIYIVASWYLFIRDIFSGRNRKP